jgi:hypothetical protein
MVERSEAHRSDERMCELARFRLWFVEFDAAPGAGRRIADLSALRAFL